MILLQIWVIQEIWDVFQELLLSLSSCSGEESVGGGRITFV